MFKVNIRKNQQEKYLSTQFSAIYEKAHIFCSSALRRPKAFFELKFHEQKCSNFSKVEVKKVLLNVNILAELK